jgi:hypothetical protein
MVYTYRWSAKSSMLVSNDKFDALFDHQSMPSRWILTMKVVMVDFMFGLRRKSSLFLQQHITVAASTMTLPFSDFIVANPIWCCRQLISIRMNIIEAITGWMDNMNASHKMTESNNDNKRWCHQILGHSQDDHGPRSQLKVRW